MASVGYARVSTGGQDLTAQRAALAAAGCDRIVEEVGSGGDRARPALAGLLASLGRGDTLVVARIDRLARSLSHLLAVIESLRGRGVGFRSLGDPIDTAGPTGTLVLQVLGAVAEFERALVRERTLAGLAAARAEGRVGGNPRLKAREREAIAALAEARRKRRLARARAAAGFWLDPVRQFRPALSWAEVATRVNAALPRGVAAFSPARLAGLARLFVVEGLLGREVLAPARSRRGTKARRRAEELAAAYLRGRPDATLADLGEALLRLGVGPPRGGSTWAPSSLKALADRARAPGEGRSSEPIRTERRRHPPQGSPPGHDAAAGG